ncbi:MAG TPA: hypothetical protein VH020_09345 [Stellaceae bacterium]|jgi:hypothetical protein|nr:hypothetical protein [Stellaceae bacterium]
MDLLFHLGDKHAAPAEDAAVDYVHRNCGKTVMLRPVRSRSAPQIRTYYACLKFVCEHAAGLNPGDEKKLHVSLKLALNEYELVELFQHKATIAIKSLGFDDMTHEEATNYIRRAYALLCERFFPNLSPEELVSETQKQLGLSPIASLIGTDAATLAENTEAA